jgi:cytochrome c-type biogenesis protein CcmF
VLGYDIQFERLQVREQANTTLYEAILHVSHSGKSLGDMHPAKSLYPTKQELFNEVGVLSQFWRDLYIVIAEFDRAGGKTVSLQIHVNPTVRLVWIAAFLLVAGGLIAISDRYRGARSRDSIAASWEVKT